MTASNFAFMAKVFLLSGAIGIAIKYGAPQLSLQPSLGLTLGLLFTPLVGMAAVLWYQSRSPG